MLARKTGKNEIELPAPVAEQFSDAKYFEVHAEKDCIRLIPVGVDRAEKVREKLESLGITRKDIEDAVAWVRSRST